MSSSAAGQPAGSRFTLRDKKPTMAVASATKDKDKDPKSASAKQHKRSRSGCFTCRLRRKKCDEGKPVCKACKHLGLCCDYKRPPWWGSSDQRREQKQFIKDIIRHTQLAKKSTHITPAAPSTPPDLCHAMSTPEGFGSEPLHGPFCHSRSLSIAQSPLISGSELYDISPDARYPNPSLHPVQYAYPVDPYYGNGIKYDRQIFVNDLPTIQDDGSTAFDIYPPQYLLDTNLSPDLCDPCFDQEYFVSPEQTLLADISGNGAICMPDQVQPPPGAVVYVEEKNRPLLDYFMNNVANLLFPVLEATQQGSSRSKIILPALETNSGFLRVCLIVSAMHAQAVDLDCFGDLGEEIMDQLSIAIQGICEALDQDIDHARLLETALAMMLFPSRAGSSHHIMPNILAWHHHFDTAESLVKRLSLHESILHPDCSAPPFNTFAMTLTGWIDILGATMRASSPVFADTWRKLNIADRVIGLSDIMGCEDRVMYLISEVACLEARKAEGIDSNRLCSFITDLNTRLSQSDRNGAITPKQQLVANITTVFRIAARIYLTSLHPTFAPDSTDTIALVASFTEAMERIPAGPQGFDRSLAWPLLVAGAHSTPDSTYRATLAERCAFLGDLAEQGSLARVQNILASLWANNDFADHGDVPLLHWRDVMAQKGLDCLLI